MKTAHKHIRDLEKELNRLNEKIAKLESDIKYRLIELCDKYPNAPLKFMDKIIFASILKSHVKELDTQTQINYIIEIENFITF